MNLFWPPLNPFHSVAKGHPQLRHVGVKLFGRGNNLQESALDMLAKFALDLNIKKQEWWTQFPLSKLKYKIKVNFVNLDIASKGYYTLCVFSTSFWVFASIFWDFLVFMFFLLNVPRTIFFRGTISI